MLDDSGRPSDLIGVMRDITIERQAQAALAESEALYRALFKAAANPAMRTDSSGLILDVNDATVDLLGLSPKQAAGQLITDYFHEPAREVLQQLDEMAPSERQPLTLESVAEVEGRQRTLRLSVIPCVAAGVTSYFWLGTRFSDRRDTTETLLPSEDGLEQRVQALQEQLNAQRRIIEQERLVHSEANRALGANLELLVDSMLQRLSRMVSGRPEAAYVQAIRETLSDLSGSAAAAPNALPARKGTWTAALTRREQEIARLIRLGMTTDEIAKILYLSSSTIAFHRKNIRRKLGVTGVGEQLGALLFRDSIGAAGEQSR